MTSESSDNIVESAYTGWIVCDTGWVGVSIMWTGWNRSHGLPAPSHVWQHVKLSDALVLGARPRYNLVVDEDVKKLTNQPTRLFVKVTSVVQNVDLRWCPTPLCPELLECIPTGYKPSASSIRVCFPYWLTISYATSLEEGLQQDSSLWLSPWKLGSRPFIVSIFSTNLWRVLKLLWWHICLISCISPLEDNWCLTQQ